MMPLSRKLLDASKDISGTPALHVAVVHDNTDGLEALCPWWTSTEKVRA